MERLTILQAGGQVALPEEWREKYGLKQGDRVLVRETPEGLLISPQTTALLGLLDELGDDLRGQNLTLDDLLAEGRNLRSDLLLEQYGIEAAGDDD
ncbi:MAG: AbrB/MazE/SpoVT family DNA-binding domain-containing protein [Anaerolineae bacterium]|nr:AbrB/MazE/SpoVT family DNA-binding domain-containing protein [Anaerolineae bacterium]